MWICKHCEQKFDFTNFTEKGNHSRWCNKNPKRKEEKQTEIKFCQTCKKDFIGKNKFCSKECIDRTHNKETRKLLSLKRKKYLKENPDKHVWKRKDKFKSEPCEIVKKYLTDNNVNFVEEFSPLNDRHFSIDIAFPDKKIGIEINGNQHYNSDGSLTDYYQERHNLIEKSGWKLIELHYSVAFNLEDIFKIINLEKNVDYSYIIKEINEKKIKKELEIKEAKKLKEREIKEKIDIIKNNLLSSDINFSKFGWVKEAANIIGCKSQKVSKWMIKNLPDFYEEKCFRRN